MEEVTVEALLARIQTLEAALEQSKHSQQFVKCTNDHIRELEKGEKSIRCPTCKAPEYTYLTGTVT